MSRRVFATICEAMSVSQQSTPPSGAIESKSKQGQTRKSICVHGRHFTNVWNIDNRPPFSSFPFILGWHVFGLLYRSDKNYEEALKCYSQALKIDKVTDQQQLMHLCLCCPCFSFLQIKELSVPGRSITCL